MPAVGQVLHGSPPVEALLATLDELAIEDDTEVLAELLLVMPPAELVVAEALPPAVLVELLVLPPALLADRPVLFDEDVAVESPPLPPCPELCHGSTPRI
jgi:hypothetical protein